MTTNSNAGARLYRVLTLANRIGPGGDALAAWCKVFGIERGTDQEKMHACSRLLLGLHEQIDEIRRELSATDYGVGEYDAPLKSAEDATSIRWLGHGWADVRNRMPELTLRVLETLPRSLKTTEQIISDDQISDLRAYLVALEKDVIDSSFDPRLEAFLVRQVRLALLATHEYYVIGLAAFQRGADESAIDWAKNAPIVQDNAESEVVRRVRGIWPWVDKWGNRAVILYGLAQLLIAANSALPRLQTSFDVPSCSMPVQQPPSLPLLADGRVAVIEEKEEPDVAAR